MERRHSTHYPVIVAHRLHIGCNYGRIYMLKADQTISSRRLSNAPTFPGIFYACTQANQLYHNQ